MKVLVLGHRGMLGKAVVTACEKAGHELIFDDFANVRDTLTLMRIDDQDGPFDAVINCAGVVPGKHRNDALTIVTNALGPRNVASVFKCHVVNVSTDCVFSGRRKIAYTVADMPDPIDVYGRSKLLGEVAAEHVTTVRTSFIGRDHGLVPWFINQPENAVVDGWHNAWWTGSTVWEVAKKLVKIAERGPRGLVHAASALVVSKYEMLYEFRERFHRKDIQVRITTEPRIYRSLKPSEGCELRSFFDTVCQLVDAERRWVP